MQFFSLPVQTAGLFGVSPVLSSSNPRPIQREPLDIGMLDQVRRGLRNGRQ
jgi:hypothetical protein